MFWNRRKPTIDAISFSFQVESGAVWLVPNLTAREDIQVRVRQVTGTCEWPWTVPWSQASPQKLMLCRYAVSSDQKEDWRGGLITFVSTIGEVPVPIPTDEMKRRAEVPWVLELRLEIIGAQSEKRYSLWLNRDGELVHRLDGTESLAATEA